MPLPAVAAQLAVRKFGLGRDGTLWALAGDRVLLRYLEGQWNAVGIDGALAFEATDFAVDEAGAIWLATRNHGLLRLLPSGTRFHRSGQFFASTDGLVAIDHVAAHRGRVYFTSSRGLSVVSPAEGGGVETFPFPAAAAAGSRAISVTAPGRVYVASNAGVLTLESRTLVPVRSRNDRALAPGATLLSDREGQLWVGTIDAGLNLLLLGRGVRFLRSSKESFHSIDIDQSGVHWVSNERRVLYFRTDQAGNPLGVGEARFEGFDALTISGIEEDPEGGLLFAMEGGVGLLSRASRGAAPVVVRHDPRFEVLRDRLVTGIHRDNADALWAISPLGVFRLAKGATEAQSVPLSNGDPWMGAMDGKSFLWVATRQGTMDVIETATQRVTPVKLPAGRHVEFVGPSPDGGVVATLDNGRSAFFSRGSGPAALAESTSAEGISWLSVLSLHKMGEVYLAAHQGDRLSQIRLNPVKVEQTILTAADLEDSDFRYLSLREGRAGQIWFTLLDGIGLLEPPNAPPPPSRLRLEPDVQSFVLPPRPNTLDLHALLADPVAPRKARYRYRLLDENAEWSEWSSDPHIPLANVAPGEYRLEIEAEDRYGRMSTPVAIRIAARAHFWESWPAQTGGRASCSWAGPTPSIGGGCGRSSRIASTWPRR